MGNNISFKNYEGNISSHKTELLVCGIFEGEKIEGSSFGTSADSYTEAPGSSQHYA